jgi:hypothetical protein
MHSQEVYGLSTIEKHDFHKNDESVCLLRVQLTIHDLTWSNETPESVNFLEKKASGCQWSPDFCCMTPPI